MVASAYAADDSHPVKRAVEAAAREQGWEREPWYETIQADVVPRLATVERASEAMGAAGLDGSVIHEGVPFPDLEPGDLVAWRLGMAQMAPFVARLDPDRRAALAQRALDLLGDAPPLVRSVIVLIATAT
jgi:hypothetical protein